MQPLPACSTAQSRAHRPLLQVLPTVRLVKGLFNETLPQHLLHLRSTGGDMPIAYLHVDCDLYAGVPFSPVCRT